MLHDPDLVPGARILNPLHPEWGEGQVQSVVGSRITANFVHAGKLVINAEHVPLKVLPPDR